MLNELRKRSRKAVDYVVDLEYNRRFPSWPGAYRGVFRSFDEARASAPPKGRLGYDHAEFGSIYDSRINKAFASDYPVLFWFERLKSQVGSIFDWGGHIGVSYYTYARYLELSASFRWCVGDVPAVVEAGRKMAAERGATGLTFTSEITGGDGFDVFFANGSLQYVDVPLADSIRKFSRKPPHLFVNKLPAYAGESFVTLENTVHAYNPYRVFNRQSFIDSITPLGYELVDTWENPDVTFKLPLHRERCLNFYSGFYFKATR